MAYLFDNVMNQLNDKEQSQSNIFQPQAGAQQQPGQGGAQQPPATTSQGGESIGSNQAANPNAGSSAAPQQRTSQSVTGAGAGTAFQKNLGKQQSPADFGALGQKVQATQDKLQNEANSYVNNYKTKDYGVGGDVTTKAADGDAENYSKLANFFGQGKAEAVGAFAPKTDTNVRDVQDIKSDSGIKNLLRRKNDASYTGGEAGFDLGLLRKDQNFNQGRDKVVAADDNLQKTKKNLTDATTGATKSAQDALDTTYTTQKQAAQAALRDYQSKLASTNDQERQAESSARQNMSQGDKDSYTNAEMQKVLDKVKGVDSYKDLRDYLGPVTGGEFLSEGRKGQDLTSRDFVDDQEAGKFNRVMDLLGDTGQRYTAGRVDPRLNFNSGAYESKLIGDASRKKTDSDYQKKQQTIALQQEHDGKLKNLHEAVQTLAGQLQDNKNRMENHSPGTLAVGGNPMAAQMMTDVEDKLIKMDPTYKRKYAEARGTAVATDSSRSFIRPSTFNPDNPYAIAI